VVAIPDSFTRRAINHTWTLLSGKAQEKDHNQHHENAEKDEPDAKSTKGAFSADCRWYCRGAYQRERNIRGQYKDVN